MTRMSRPLAAAAIMLMSGIAVSYAQYGTGRALLAYPMKGQTLEQENADRSACHDWAVAQTGYDPHTCVCSPAILDHSPSCRCVLRTPALPAPIGRFRGSHGKRRETASERTLLRLPSGRTGLLRGQRLPSFKIGASNANFDL